MNGTQLAQALRSGQRVYGTAILSTSPLWPMALQRAALDFVFLDTEHTPVPRDTLAWMCQTYRALNICPIVRISSPDPFLACMALDGGAGGIVAPYIESVDQVRELRGAVKLRPLKGKKLRELLDADAELPSELLGYISQFNAGHVMILNIESVPALERLDDLLCVPEIEAVLVGPHDLSVSLGVPEQYDHPKFVEAVNLIIRKVISHQVGVGVYSFGDARRQIGQAQQGANLILHSSDRQLFADVLAEHLGSIRDAMGDKPPSEERKSLAI